MSGVLYNTPSEIVQQLLVDIGLGVMPPSTTNWPIYDSVAPDSPDNAITVFNTTGIDQGRIMVDGQTIIKYGLQVRVRAQSKSEGFQKASRIHQAFDEDVLRTEVVVGYHQYLVQAIHNQGYVLDLGYELPASRRRIFVINCIASIRWDGLLGTGSGTGS